MKRNSIVFFLIVTLILSGCSYAQEDSSDNSDYQIDYENAEEFEEALNSGSNVKGKVVKFEVTKYVPDSLLGINCWSGEHLNFISSKELTVNSGDVIVGRITKEASKTLLLGSWKIYYEVLEIIPSNGFQLDETIVLAPGMVAISQSSSYYVGKQYEDVISQLEEDGFTNISSEVAYDLYFGTSEQETVASITIGDASDFKKGDSFNLDAPVVVVYHMPYKENPEFRTYHGVVYDRAFSCSGKDGLRSKFMCIYLFNESDHKVKYIMKTTAGGLKTRGKSGVYEGSLDESVIITWEFSDWEASDTTTTFEVWNSDDSEYWYDGIRKYSEIDVESGINKINNW